MNTYGGQTRDGDPVVGASVFYMSAEAIQTPQYKDKDKVKETHLEDIEDKKEDANGVKTLDRLQEINSDLEVCMYPIISL